MATGQFIHANGGLGETSYANNSSYQSKVMSIVKPILEESIKSMFLRSVPRCLKVADLGCSTGPNALQMASQIIEIIDTMNCEPPTLQFFLNDQFRNDFNNIFESLPNFYQRLREDKGEERLASCFVNATPGSFYGRLFPNNSIHLFHSSTSLHWLSQAPKGLVNKRNIYITSTSPPQVYQAYLEQFQQDFSQFLRSRAKELVQGGGMVLTFVGRDETRQIITPWGLIGSALHDMVSEGLIEEAKLESVNMPRYGATADEVMQLIEAEGSFTVQKFETIKSRWDEGMNKNGDEDTNKSADFIAKYVRATTEPLIRAEFGEGIVDDLFFRFRTKVGRALEHEQLEHANLVIFMTKNK